MASAQNPRKKKQETKQRLNPKQSLTLLRKLSLKRRVPTKSGRGTGEGRAASQRPTPFVVCTFLQTDNEVVVYSLEKTLIFLEASVEIKHNVAALLKVRGRGAARQGLIFFK